MANARDLERGQQQNNLPPVHNRSRFWGYRNTSEARLLVTIAAFISFLYYVLNEDGTVNNTANNAALGASTFFSLLKFITPDPINDIRRTNTSNSAKWIAGSTMAVDLGIMISVIVLAARHNTSGLWGACGAALFIAIANGIYQWRRPLSQDPSSASSNSNSQSHSQQSGSNVSSNSDSAVSVDANAVPDSGPPPIALTSLGS